MAHSFVNKRVGGTWQVKLCDRFASSTRAIPERFRGEFHS